MLFGRGIVFMIVFNKDSSMFHMFFPPSSWALRSSAAERLWWLFHGCDADCRGGKRAECSGDLQLSSTRSRVGGANAGSFYR